MGTPVADSGGTSGQLLENGKRRYRLIFSLVSISGGGEGEFEIPCDALRASIAGMHRRVVMQKVMGRGAGATDL